MFDISSLAEFLEQFGGWGVSIILLGGIIYLYKSTHNLLEKRNSDFIDVLRETTSMLQQNADDSKRIESLLNRIERLLDDIKGDRK